MRIRKLQAGEEEELWRLFSTTIHTVNRRDYRDEQLRAWAPATPDLGLWRRRTRQRDPFVCVEEDQIVGYADLQPSGLIDHFYVRHDRQRRGVGARLMAAIEASAARLGLAELHSHVSITARPFFERHGFVVEAEQDVRIGEVVLRNYRMRRVVRPSSP